MFLAPPTAWAGVVINEIFYKAPDDLDDLLWIELHNDGDVAVDLSDWNLDRGSLHFRQARRSPLTSTSSRR
jgi:lamin tail-like protein